MVGVVDDVELLVILDLALVSELVKEVLAELVVIDRLETGVTLGCGFG